VKPTAGEAAALFKLDLLSGADLLRLAGGASPAPGDGGADIAAVLGELGVELPAREVAVKTALKLYLRRIVEGEVAPFEGVRAINLELTLAFYPHEDSPLCFFPRRAGEPHRHGVLWGLERMYDCYRALRDGGGDPAAMERLTRQLHREAGKALDRLAALG
jgi:hypothetical protein